MKSGYLRSTLESVINQTIKPVKWVIVDDGSSDGTLGILSEYAERHDWIEVVRIQRDAKRDLGITEIRAFAEGYKRAKQVDYDFVVKLDCDLELPLDYFEGLLGQFRGNPRLGIASGVYLEEKDGGWFPVAMPDYHAAGASKFVRGGRVSKRSKDSSFTGVGTQLTRSRPPCADGRRATFRISQFLHLKKEVSAMDQA